MHVCKCLYAYVCVCVCARVCACVYEYVYVYIFVRMCFRVVCMRVFARAVRAHMSPALPHPMSHACCDLLNPYHALFISVS